MTRKAYIILVGVFAADRLSKMAVEHFLSAQRQVDLLGGLFSLNLIYNNGAAFSLFAGARVVFVAITCLVVAGFIAYLEWSRIKQQKLVWLVPISVGLLLGGALGNLYDRMMYGYVVDFIDFHVWPVFNVADIFIVSGAALFVLSYFMHDAGRAKNE